MRFAVGPIPPTAGFAPEEDRGWRRLREPSPFLLQLVALPVAIGTLAIMLAAWSLVLGRQVAAVKWPTTGWAALPLFVVLIPLHEWVHALCHPAWGRSNSSVFGFWPKTLLFYAHYDGPLSRNRLIGILTAPTLVLSVLPLLLAAAGAWHWLLVLASVLNGLAASGDLTASGMLLFQVPWNATVRNQGYYTWWRGQAE